MQELFDFTQQIARSAGSMAIAAWQNPQSIRVSEKAPRDLVTEVDQAIEQYVISQIYQHYPEHSILSEEQGLSPGNEFMWIIDPIDGTCNFANGIPHFAISIAVKHHDKLIIGVIYDPIRDEMFTAKAGEGAFLNGKRIHSRAHLTLEKAIIATGFPSKCQQFSPAFLDCLRVIFPDVLGIRRAGAATLDLAYIAAGRIDGYWEFDVRQWDIAAGQLLIEEAGGSVSDIAGEINFPQHGVIAGTHGVRTQMVERFAPIWGQQLEELFVNHGKRFYSN